MTKKDIRLQVFVTESMDDDLNDLAELMGMRKNDIVRVAIANYIMGYKTSVNMVRDYVNQEMPKQK